MWWKYCPVDATAQRGSRRTGDRTRRSAGGRCREVWRSCSLSPSDVSPDWIYESKLMAFRNPLLPLTRASCIPFITPTRQA
jgi:hypothetical protein